MSGGHTDWICQTLEYFVLTGMPLGMNREQIEKRLQGEGQFT